MNLAILRGERLSQRSTIPRLQLITALHHAQLAANQDQIGVARDELIFAKTRLSESAGQHDAKFWLAWGWVAMRIHDPAAPSAFQSAMAWADHPNTVALAAQWLARVDPVNAFALCPPDERDLGTVLFPGPIVGGEGFRGT